MDAVGELASMFKQRDNKPYLGPQIGTILMESPNIQVALGEKIVLTKDHLILSAHVLGDYQRQLRITGSLHTKGVTGDLTLRKDQFTSYKVPTGNIQGASTLMGEMIYQDTLKKGDEVLLIPSTDEQTYYLVDKVVRL